MAVTPVLQNINAFDVSDGTIIYFSVSGSTEFVRSSIVTFKDYNTGDVVATNTYSTTQLFNVIPPDLEGLENGQRYYVVVDVYSQVDPTGHTSMGTSAAKPAWCLPNPTLDFIAPTGSMTTNIETSTYTFELLFEMYEDSSLISEVTNKVQSYKFDLYNGTEGTSVLADTSGLIYGTGELVPGSDVDYILQHTFNGLVNNNSYFVTVTITTERGMVLEATSLYVVPRLDDITFAVAQVRNNSCNGYIEVQSNITNIAGYTNATFTEGDGYIDLTQNNKYIIWGYNPNTNTEDNTLSFPTDEWSMLLSAKNLIPSDSNPFTLGDKSYILRLSNYDELREIYVYIRADESNYWLELYSINGATEDSYATFIQSNILTSITDSTDVYILIRFSNGWYDIQWSTTLGS